MDTLTTLIQPTVVFLIVFSAPLFHGILAAGQAVGRWSRMVLASSAAPAFAVSTGA